MGRVRRLWARRMARERRGLFRGVFGLIARFAPLEFTHDGRWRVGLRPIAAGLFTRAPLKASMTVFVLLMLATVTVDGFMEMLPWAALVEWFLASRGGVDANPAAYGALQTALLISRPAAFGGALFCRHCFMIGLGSRDRMLQNWQGCSHSHWFRSRSPIISPTIFRC